MPSKMLWNMQRDLRCGSLLALVLGAGLLLCASQASLAGEGPVLAPTRDVAVTYRVIGGDRMRGAAVIKMTYSDHDRKVRLDLFAFDGATVPFGSLIYNQPANQILSLVYANNAYYRVPAEGRVNPGLMLGANMQYERRDTRVILGRKCTDWQVRNGAVNAGSACVTDDGIVLHGTRRNPHRELEAVAIHYGTPPNSLFEPDKGMHLLNGRHPAGSATFPR